MLSSSLFTTDIVHSRGRKGKKIQAKRKKTIARQMKKNNPPVKRRIPAPKAKKVPEPQKDMTLDQAHKMAWTQFCRAKKCLNVPEIDRSECEANLVAQLDKSKVPYWTPQVIYDKPFSENKAMTLPVKKDNDYQKGIIQTVEMFKEKCKNYLTNQTIQNKKELQFANTELERHARLYQAKAAIEEKSCRENLAEVVKLQKFYGHKGDDCLVFEKVSPKGVYHHFKGLKKDLIKDSSQSMDPILENANKILNLYKITPIERKNRAIHQEIYE